MLKENADYFSKSRVEAFSDGIFAVVITLLVLDIRIARSDNPDNMRELANAVIRLLPKVISWIVSFLFVCVVWVNHHRIFESLRLITHSIFRHRLFLLASFFH